MVVIKMNFHTWDFATFSALHPCIDGRVKGGLAGPHTLMCCAAWLPFIAPSCCLNILWLARGNLGVGMANCVCITGNPQVCEALWGGGSDSNRMCCIKLVKLTLPGGDGTQASCVSDSGRT
jgi:hypothetical protein